jgi:DEAD/DEAH box helicase domain-containing protein
MLHEKAIYLVEGALYQVETLDYDNRKAFVREVECDYYTTAITYTKVTILDTFADRPQASGVRPQAPGPRPKASDQWAAGEGERTAEYIGLREDLVAPGALGLGPGACHGEVHVVSRVVGFKKIKFYTNENVGSGELDLPEQQMHTTSYWLKIPGEVMAALPYGAADRRDGVLGLAHAMHNVAPLLLMCDVRDIGLSIDGLALEGASRVGGASRHAKVEDLSASPTIFLYDNFPGGIGFSEPLFGMHDALLAQTAALIGECPCESGCPSCVGPEGMTGPHAKAVAEHLLRSLTAAQAAA